MGSRDDIVRKLIRECKPEDKKWYKKDNIVVSKTYSPVAADEILKDYATTKTIPYIYVDEECDYSPGERKGMREKLKQIAKDAEKSDEYIADSLSKSPTPRMEDRMCHILFAQGKVSGFEVLDYQIPTSRGGHDKIDLLLKKGDVVYMTEVKKYSPISQKYNRNASDETLLRCVLEVQTYYQKINENFYATYNIKDKSKLKKAVLVDKDTFAYKTFKNEDEKWAKRILKLFGITMLRLDRESGGAQFKIEVEPNEIED